MKPIAFIVSKPLQLLMVLSIVGQLRAEKKTHLVIVDSFANAKVVCDNMRLIDWTFGDFAIHFADTMTDAYAFVLCENEIGTLFIDSDVGFRRHLSLVRMKLQRPSLKIIVYEEGIGTYRTDLYAGMKAWIFPLLGIGVHFGGNYLTDGIYVCNPVAYLRAFPNFKKTVVGIDQGPTEIILKLTSAIYSIFGYKIIKNTTNQICNIYLSNWNIDFEFVKKFSKYTGDGYVKLHPHIKSEITFDGLLVVGNSIPAEILIIDAMKNYREVNVFHHGSSVCDYLRDQSINFTEIA
jgi:hypothetical protein